MFLNICSPYPYLYYFRQMRDQVLILSGEQAKLLTSMKNPSSLKPRKIQHKEQIAPCFHELMKNPYFSNKFPYVFIVKILLLTVHIFVFG